MVGAACVWWRVLLTCVTACCSQFNYNVEIYDERTDAWEFGQVAHEYTEYTFGSPRHKAKARTARALVAA